MPKKKIAPLNPLVCESDLMDEEDLNKSQSNSDFLEIEDEKN